MPRACLLTPVCQPWRSHRVPRPPLCATQGTSRAGDRDMNMHPQSMPMTCVWQPARGDM